MIYDIADPPIMPELAVFVMVSKLVASVFKLPFVRSMALVAVVGTLSVTPPVFCIVML